MNSGPLGSFFEEIPVAGLADALIARQAAGRIASELNFPSERQAEAVLVASELAINHVAHATRQGKIRISGSYVAGTPVLSIASLDKGPGMADLPGALRGKSSTDGGLGAGLGAVARLSDQMSACSGRDGIAPCPCPEGSKGYATVISCTLWPERCPPAFIASGGIDFFFISAPRKGGRVCGDGIDVKCDQRYVRVAVADGAGHGMAAHDMTRMALKKLDKQALFWPPDSIISSLDSAVSGGRGLSAHVLLLDRLTARLLSAGVGNIKTHIYLNGKHIMPKRQRGVVGHHKPQKIRCREFNQISGLLVLMHTDGHPALPSLNPGRGSGCSGIFVKRSSRDQGAAFVSFDSSALLGQILFEPDSTLNDDTTLVVWQWHQKPPSAFIS